MMVQRLITRDIEDALRRQVVVALIDPRQVGKTTLALEIGRPRNAFYLDLEDRDDRYSLSKILEAVGVREFAEELRARYCSLSLLP